MLLTATWYGGPLVTQLNECSSNTAQSLDIYSSYHLEKKIRIDRQDVHTTAG